MSESQLVDYTVQGFTIPIIRDGAKGYASINAEMYYDFDREDIVLPSDGLDVSGNYHVYLLHPLYGSTHFTIEPDNSYSGLTHIGGAIWLSDDILKEIFDAIEAKKNSR